MYIPLSLLLKHGLCRLLTHFIVDIHVRNPDKPQMDFQKLLIVLKTVPDQALPPQKRNPLSSPLVFQAKFVYEGKMSCFCSRCPPPSSLTSASFRSSHLVS